MPAAQSFDRFLRDFVTPHLRGRGFLKSGYSFVLRLEGNRGLIQFQKGRKSTAAEILFTVNLGVTSERLRRFEGETTDSKPSIDGCHWSTRLGFLLPEREDKWWSIRTDAEAEKLGVQFREFLPVAVEAIGQNISDIALRDLWLRGESPGLSDLNRLRNLSVLLKVFGPARVLEPVLSELKNLSAGRATESMVERHIRKLEMQQAS